ncbi:MAG: VWA domain-containing protein, partial [Myxococcota bacterium]
MGLTWFAPLVLGLSVLALLPVAAHLARQTPRTRQPFGAMLLLQRVVKRLRRRQRVRDPILLVLRVLALLALVLGLAGPQWTMPGGPAEYGATGQVVLVVDRSLSMSLQDSGATLLQRARERAADVVSGLPEGVALGLVVYDDAALRLTNALTTDHARVTAQVDAIQPTSGGSNLRAALLEARRL